MAEIASITDDQQRCGRTDGREWRCPLQAAEGKAYCHRHLQQNLLRRRKQPVPDFLKLKRAPPLNSEHDSDDVPPKRAKKEDSDVSASDDQTETVVLKLKLGGMEIGTKVFQCPKSFGLRRPSRSENCEPIPTVTTEAKQTAVDGMQAELEEVGEVFVSETKWSWLLSLLIWQSLLHSVL